MNEGWKYGLFFLGGAVLGLGAAMALGKGKLDMKPVAADLLSRGMDVKDAIMGKVETVREDLQDLAAQARQAADKRKEARAAEAKA